MQLEKYLNKGSNYQLTFLCNNVKSNSSGSGRSGNY